MPVTTVSSKNTPNLKKAVPRAAFFPEGGICLEGILFIFVAIAVVSSIISQYGKKGSNAQRPPHARPMTFDWSGLRTSTAHKAQDTGVRYEDMEDIFDSDGVPSVDAPQQPAHTHPQGDSCYSHLTPMEGAAQPGSLSAAGRPASFAPAARRPFAAPGGSLGGSGSLEGGGQAGSLPRPALMRDPMVPEHDRPPAPRERPAQPDIQPLVRPQPRRASARRPIRRPAGSLAVSRQSVVSGIIWSEILARPGGRSAHPWRT